MINKIKLELDFKELRDVYNALGIAINDLNEDVKIIKKSKKEYANRFSKIYDAVKGKIKNKYTADVEEIERFRKNLVSINKEISRFM